VVAEKATGLVLRTSDWSESSRIATFWTREFGKVRVLAKGGRRLKSNFENALDLLSLCSIVLLRKSSGSLDLLTEARVLERFPRLRADLPALYAAYYLAELLSEWTQDYDPHPFLFDQAVETLRNLAGPGVPTPLRLARFELVLLRELGYSPVLNQCSGCGKQFLGSGETFFSSAAGGILCSACRQRYRDARPVSVETIKLLNALDQAEETDALLSMAVRKEIRHLLNQYVTYLMGRRPKLLSYLGS
jgi:DNA repair protein RecO (recombination protein O)